MRFEKGNKFASGRPKGAKNKLSADLRAKYGEFLHEDYDLFVKDYKGLTGFQRMKVRAELWDVYFPRQKQVEVDVNHAVNEATAEYILTELKKTFVYEHFRNRLKKPGNIKETE